MRKTEFDVLTENFRKTRTCLKYMVEIYGLSKPKFCYVSNLKMAVWLTNQIKGDTNIFIFDERHKAWGALYIDFAKKEAGSSS